MSLLREDRTVEGHRVRVDSDVFRKEAAGWIEPRLTAQAHLIGRVT